MLGESLAADMYREKVEAQATMLAYSQAARAAAATPPPAVVQSVKTQPAQAQPAQAQPTQVQPAGKSCRYRRQRQFAGARGFITPGYQRRGYGKGYRCRSGQG